MSEIFSFYISVAELSKLSIEKRQIKNESELQIE